MMVTIARIMQAGIRNFGRNAWLSTAATAVMTVTLSIILVSYVSSVTLASTLKNLINKIDISIYLKDSVTLEQASELQRKVESLDNVRSVKYVSKLEALEIYRRQNQFDPILLSAVSEKDNPLPQSLQIKANDPNRLDPIVEYFNTAQTRGVLQDKNPISYSGERKSAIDRIVGFINFMKRAGLSISLVFTVISALIIFNTIRMAIFTRREEIEIMKLVGATPWFIRGPFIFEAALYGVIAAIIAVSLCSSLLLSFGPRLAGYVDVDTILGIIKHDLVLVTAVQMGIGILIGATSSLLALTKYLKL